jgi:hypothetical protein
MIIKNKIENNIDWKYFTQENGIKKEFEDEYKS